MGGFFCGAGIHFCTTLSLICARGGFQWEKDCALIATVSFASGAIATLIAQRMRLNRTKEIVLMNSVVLVLGALFWNAMILFAFLFMAISTDFVKGQPFADVALQIAILIVGDTWSAHPWWAFILLGMSVCLIIGRGRRSAATHPA